MIDSNQLAELSTSKFQPFMEILIYSSSSSSSSSPSCVDNNEWHSMFNKLKATGAQ